MTFSFCQQILDYASMTYYENYPTFTTTCYDDSHNIINAPVFSYTDSNLYEIQVSSIFQLSGFYNSSDPSTVACLANILMVSWDTTKNEMILKTDYSNIPDVIDKSVHTFG
jgi:hypothetical protein